MRFIGYDRFMSAPAHLSDSTPPRAEQIVAAVRRLFRQYGYKRTSVDDIAREAGLSKATLYLSFASKEEMFAAMIRQFRALVIERCRAAEASGTPILQRVAALINASHGSALEWFGDATHIRELSRFAAEHPLEEVDGDDRKAFRARLVRMLADAEERGEIQVAQRGFSIDDVASTLLHASHGAKQASGAGAEAYRATLGTIVRLVVGPLHRVD